MTCIDCLATPGGKIAILTGLVLLGTLLTLFGIPWAEHFSYTSLTVLLASISSEVKK